MTEGDDLVPVMLTIRLTDGKVSVCNLHQTSEGLAIEATDTYRPIGQIREATWQEEDPKTGFLRKKKGWTWWYDERGYGGATGRALVKKAAVAALLGAGGYREAPPNAANPGLFDL